MLTLHLKRSYKGPQYTIGHLYIQNQFFCDTLEDTDRKLKDEMTEEQITQIKVYGETAIPTGTYHIDMDTISPKFKNRVWAKPYKGKIPAITSVKGFSGVLIHPGNKASDTFGCILVGQNQAKGQVLNSQNIFHELMKKYLIPAHNRGEEIKIVIE